LNFLELVDLLRQEAGTSGDPIVTLSGTIPAETQRLKNWVKDAWNKVQIREKWNFMRYEATAEVEQYASIVTPDEFDSGHVADWTGCGAKIAKLDEPAHKAQWMTVYPYEHFRDGPGKDPTRTGRPSVIAVDTRLESLHIAPAADQAYRLYYDYWATPQELEVDSDEPMMPKRYHMLIVWLALTSYGLYESAAEAVRRGSSEASPLWSQLYKDQLETATMRHGI
jgi:hypothetical protein